MQSCAEIFNHLLNDNETFKEMKLGSISRFDERFTWERVLKEYEDLLIKWYPESIKSKQPSLVD
ncbi:hypothetical protein D3C85_1323910 [compost metagenome]